MIRKLLFQNVKNSLKNYLAYFSVLSVSICIFYAFNCYLMSEKLKSVSNYFTSNDSSVIFATIIFMTGISAISFIATKNIYSYRSKEFSVYISLGLPAKIIILITTLEIICITIFALIIGILLGSILFEILIIIVFSAFNRNYQFDFELNKTAFIFTVLFYLSSGSLTSIYNSFIMSKKSPLDLYNISPQKRINNFRKTKLPILIFRFIFSVSFGVISVLSLYSAIQAIFDANEKGFNKNIIITVFTYLVFSSSFVVLIFNMFCMKKTNAGLRIFLKSKIVTDSRNIIALVIISSIMLTTSFCMFTVGSIYTGVQEQRLKNNYPFDIVFTVRQQQIDSEREENRYYYIDEGVQEVSSRYGINDLFEYNIYTSTKDSNTKKIFEESDYKEITKANYSVDYIIKLSDYNTIRKIQGEGEIFLNDNECAIHSQDYSSFINSKNIKSIKIDEINYNLKKVYSGAFAQDCSEVTINGEHGIVFILPDIEAERLEKYKNVTIINTKTKIETKPNVYFHKLNSSYSLYLTSIINNYEERIEYTETNDGYIKMRIGNNLAKVFVSSENIEMGRASYIDISFFFFYLGFIFAIISIVLLMLYKLGSVNDEIYEYMVLDKLGVTKTKQKIILFRELIIVFGVPIMFSIFSSSAILCSVIKIFQNIILDKSILFLFVLSQSSILIFYLGLFAITYFSLSELIIAKE